MQRPLLLLTARGCRRRPCRAARKGSFSRRPRRLLGRSVWGLSPRIDAQYARRPGCNHPTAPMFASWRQGRAGMSFPTTSAQLSVSTPARLRKPSPQSLGLAARSPPPWTPQAAASSSRGCGKITREHRRSSARRPLIRTSYSSGRGCSGASLEVAGTCSASSTSPAAAPTTARRRRTSPRRRSHDGARPRRLP
jgi:hypothetical protein